MIANADDKDRQEIREYLESLSIAEIGMLLDSRFAPVIFEHLEDSPVLTQKFEQVLDNEYNDMEPGEQAKFDQFVARVSEKIKRSLSLASA